MKDLYLKFNRGVGEKKGGGFLLGWAGREKENEDEMAEFGKQLSEVGGD